MILEIVAKLENIQWQLRSIWQLLKGNIGVFEGNSLVALEKSILNKYWLCVNTNNDCWLEGSAPVTSKIPSFLKFQ